MEEQEGTQVEQAEPTQSEETATQPTVEELQKQLDEAKNEIDRKENVLQQTKRELKDARQRGASKTEIESLTKRMESQEEFLANALDDLAHRVAGEEEPAPTRKSYSQQLEERRAKSKPEEPKPDPDAQKFLNYCEALDLHLDYDDFESCDPLVQEALGEGRTFKQGLKYLKDKMKPKDVDIDKVLDEKLRLAKEQWMKDMNLTTEGAGKPSGSAAGFEKTEQDYADGKISYSEYKEARKSQGILS